MGLSIVTYALCKKYVDDSLQGGGALKGKNCTIDDISAIIGGNRVTFKWTLDDGTVQTGYMDVMDGADGQDGVDTNLPAAPTTQGSYVLTCTVDANGDATYSWESTT